MFIYALMCNLNNFDKKSKFVVVLQSIKNINNCFNFNKVFKLLNYEKNNYVIDLIFNVEFFFDFLYVFFEKKLHVLQNYLHKNFALNKIRHFVNFVEAFVIFVTKKNENLLLCVDYRKLNVFTIKNRYSLFLIDEILNCLMSVCYFTKLNFRNVYHRIRIRKKNK